MHIETKTEVAVPGKDIETAWEIFGWDQLEKEAKLLLVFSVPGGFKPAGKEADAFDPDTLTLKLVPETSTGSIVWSTSKDSQPPFHIQVELFIDGLLDSTSALTLGRPTGGIETDSGTPSITAVGWSGSGKGTWSYSWSGMTGHQYWTGSGGHWQLTDFHTDFTVENIPDQAVIEICSRGRIPFAAWSGSTRKPVLSNPRRSGVTYFDYGNWKCTWQTYISSYGAILSIGHFFGDDGRHQPGCCGPIPAAYYDWEVWVKSIDGYEFPSPDSALQDQSTLAYCGSKNGISDPRECPTSAYPGGLGNAGDPINTRTGGFSYTVGDLSVPTSAGQLAFQRSYSSTGTEMYDDLLGYGWTHNHDIRLIFDGDPLGERGYMLFKGTVANQYRFVVNWDGTYIPYPGVLASLTRDEGPPILYTIRTPDQAFYVFDEYGKLLTWSDPQGHAWTYSYDGNDRLETVTDDTEERYLDFTYDQNGMLESVADQTGRDVTFGYDEDGDLASVTDVLDHEWTYAYVDEHLLQQVLDPASRQVLRTEYDEEGRAYQQYDGDDNLVLEVTYNTDGTTVFTDALGNQTTHTYDERDTFTASTNEESQTSSRGYDASFRPDTLTDENDNTTQLTWSDGGANLTQLIDAEDNQIDLVYNDLNSLTQITDGRGYSTTYTYDDQDPDPGRWTLLLSQEDALENVTTYTYTTAEDDPQPLGLLKTVTDPLDHVIEYVYDEFGQRTEVIDPLDQSTLFTYDSLGRLQAVEDPLGRAHWTCYDDAGRIVRSVANASGDGGTPETDPCDAGEYEPSSDPDVDRITTSVYDDSSNRIATIDPAGVITRTYYDSNNRPRYVVQNLSGQAIGEEDPPAYDPDYPDRNLRSETVYDDNGKAIATIDNAGIITRTYYDSLNRPEYVAVNLIGQAVSVGTPPEFDPDYPDENVLTQMVYDDAGNPIATIDTLGLITRTYYDGDNRPFSVVQNLIGQSIAVATPPDRDPQYPDRNLRTDTAYDENGNAIATTDPSGIITRTYYDPLNRPEFVVQNLVGQGIGVETPPGYDPDYPDQNVRTQYVYDDAGNQIAAIDTNGVITRTYFDDTNRPTDVVRNLAGQAISVETPPAFDPDYPDENVRTQTVSDDSGQAIATIDNAGVIARTYYDGLGRARYVVRNLTGQSIAVETPPDYDPDFPDQNVRTETVYDANGDAVAAIGPNGVVTRTYYDELHRVVTVVQNLTGQSISETTPPDFNPAYPDQNVRTDTVYGDGGQVGRTTDPLGHETIACYDGQYRAVKTVQNPSVGDPCGSYTPGAEADEDITTLMAYDGAGNQVSVTNPNGNETTYTYDGVYRQASETDPLTHASQFGYDLNGQRVILTDAESVATRYEYDALGRMTAVVENYRPGYDPDEETNVRTEYSYDGVGNRLEILDGNSHSTNFTYDDLGRLLTETDALDHTTTYSYDAAGNRASLEDANGYTTTFSYDGLNRLTGIDYPSPDADVSFTYDAAGNRVEMTDGVGTTEWDYDALSRPTSVTDPFDDTVGYEYDGLGNRTSLTYPDTSSVGYVYDAASRLETLTDWDSLATTYVYDKAGRLSTVTLPNGIVSSYEYDDGGRLLSLTHEDDPITFASYGYTYDDVGNRLTADEAVRQPDESTASVAITYDYDPLDRLTAADYDDETYFHYTYDAVGNRLTEATESGTTTYVYDDANRLTDVGEVELTWDDNGNLLDDGASEYTYDHANRLASVTQGMDTYEFSYNGLGDRLSQTVNSSPISYTLDPSSSLRAGLVSGLTQVLADGTNAYLYGVARIGEEQPGGWQYHLGDALGSVRQLASSSAAVVLARSYEPFGDTVASMGTAATVFGFTGEQEDNTGLVYLRARYYGPGFSRFLARDPWPGRGILPISYNAWVYANQNPVGLTDPTGMYAKEQHHFALTLQWAAKEAATICPACLQIPGNWFGYWVAWGSRHMDDPGLESVSHIEFHFKPHPAAEGDVQRAIETRDPVLFGAALHGLQDYWSHTYEGYQPPGGHAWDSFVGGCDVEFLSGTTPCQRLPNQELGILAMLWVHGEIDRPTRDALAAEMAYLGAEVSSLTTSNLFDMWLREQPGAADTRRAAYWKNFWGYDTDSYYPHTRRDRNMESETRAVLRQYFEEVGADVCLITAFGYSPPSDGDIVQFLSGH